MPKATVKFPYANANVQKWAWAIGLFAFLLYGNTLFNGYNLDDELVTMGHRLTSKGITAIPEIFTSPYHLDPLGYHYEYRPVTLASFAVEHSIFGEHVWVSHLINVLLYALTCLLFFKLITLAFPNSPQSFPLLTALLFVAYPLHTEVVASIKNRDEILALLGGILASLTMLRYIESQKFIWAVLMLVSLLFGLFSKQSVISFVLLIPLLAVYKDASWRALITVIICCCTALAAVLISRSSAGSLWLLLAAPPLFTLSLRSVFHWLQSRETAVKAVNAFFRKVSMLLRRAMDSRMTHLTPDHSGAERPTVLMVLSLSLVLLDIIWGLKYLSVVSIILLLLHPIVLGRVRPVLLLAALIPTSLIALTPETSHRMLPFMAFVVTMISYRLFGNALNRSWLGSIHILTVASYYTVAYFSGGNLVDHWAKGLYLTFPIIPMFMIHRGKSMYGIASVGLLLLVISAFVSQLRGLWNIELIAGGLMLLTVAVALQYKKLRPTVLLAAALVTGASHVLLLPNSVEPVLTTSKTPHALGTEHSSVRKDVVANKSALTPDRPLTFVEYPLGTDASLDERLATAGTVVGHYIRLAAVPYPMAFYYGYSSFDKVDFSNRKAVLTWILFLGLIVLAIFATAKRSPIGYGLWAFLISILVFSNLLEPVAGMVADRLTYTASLGFCIVLGYAYAFAYDRYVSDNIGQAVLIIAGAVLISYSILTFTRNLMWRDSLTLMRNDIEHVPNSAQAHSILASHLMMTSFNVGSAYEIEALRREAVVHFKRSIDIWPDYLNFWYDLGRTYVLLEERSNALPCFKEAHRLDSTFYDATINVAMISEQRGNIPQAIDYYQRCIRLNPEMREPFGNLSYLLFREGRFAESVAVNELAIIQHPAWKDPYLNLSRTYQAMGNVERANDYALRAQQMP